MAQNDNIFSVLCNGSNVECIEQHYEGEIANESFFCKNTPNADNTGTNFLQVHLISYCLSLCVKLLI